MKEIATLLLSYLLVIVGILLISSALDNSIKESKIDDTSFYNGEILYPDYVHQDTLIVTNAVFLNKWMEEYDVASDGDIMDLLKVGTVKYN